MSKHWEDAPGPHAACWGISAAAQLLGRQGKGQRCSGLSSVLLGNNGVEELRLQFRPKFMKENRMGHSLKVAARACGILESGESLSFAHCVTSGVLAWSGLFLP